MKWKDYHNSLLNEKGVRILNLLSVSFHSNKSIIGPLYRELNSICWNIKSCPKASLNESKINFKLKVLKVLFLLTSGALMDSFTITHYQHLFPVDEFKVQEVISQEYLEYGAHVDNSSLVSCLKNFRFSEESELYEQAELYMANHYNKVNVGCFRRLWKAFMCFYLTPMIDWKGEFRAVSLLLENQWGRTQRRTP